MKGRFTVDKNAIEVLRTHAKRDADQGRAWVCVCPLCDAARRDPELVSQVQSGLKPASRTAKKPTNEPA